jgi:hypothetical protein
VIPKSVPPSSRNPPIPEVRNARSSAGAIRLANSLETRLADPPAIEGRVGAGEVFAGGADGGGLGVGEALAGVADDDRAPVDRRLARGQLCIRQTPLQTGPQPADPAARSISGAIGGLARNRVRAGAKGQLLP